MKKILISLILMVVMILSLNVVAFADPGGGGWNPPIIASIPISIDYPNYCPENDQDQNNNRNQYQP
ncbi:MAG: hypothetical protein FWC77_05205 [Defluviitaleaceae bacterium]|nr:hypothetical protein [Defluviitaleaceae bacterium]